MSNKIVLSEEKQFMYHDSFNKGHIQTPSMIENCIGLSNHAKTVYSNILNHVFEKGHYAFPSTYKLAISSGCSVNSVINYVNELVECGLLYKESRGRGKSNHYHLKDVHEVPLLRVSEMFWRCMSKLTIAYGWKKILPGKDKILKFMSDNDYRLQDMETDEGTQAQLMELLKHTLKGGKLEVGLLPKNMKFQKPSTVAPTPTVAEATKDVVTEQRTVSLGVKTNHWSQMPSDEWGAEQFKEYYYDKYLDHTGQPHPRNIKRHTGQLRRIIKTMEGKHELLRGYIDNIFLIGYDNVTLDQLSAHRIGELQSYILSGKKPFYLEKKEPKQRDTVSGVVAATGDISSDEMLKKMLGGK